MGKDYTVDDYTIDTSGRYCYIFRGVNPQYMGENIHATLYATVNGVQVSVEIPIYSIRQYCVNRLEKTTDPEFKALLSDLLLYGEKAQIYVGYNTDNLVTEGVTLSASTFTTLDSSYSKFSQTGIESDEVRYSAAALVMSNNIFLRLSITTDNPELYTYEIIVNGRKNVYTAEDLVKASNGKYYLYFRNIYANEFNDVVTAVIKKDGIQIGTTLNYSVNTYIYHKQDKTDTFGDLLKAVCNYGNSAKIYAE